PAHRTPSDPLTPPTRALAPVNPADAPIDDSATFCLTSAITRLRAATGNDQGCGRQCSANDVRCRCPSQLAASWKCKRFARDGVTLPVKAKTLDPNSSRSRG